MPGRRDTSPAAANQRTPDCNKPVGLVVEGQTEARAYPLLLKPLGLRLAGILHFGGQFQTRNATDLARFVTCRIVPRVQAMRRKGVASIVVVLDREERNDCPGQLASNIEAIIVHELHAQYQYAGQPPISVVCADRRFENWLIADPDGIARHKLIQDSPSRAVGSQADGKDAIMIINRVLRHGRSYMKTTHGPQLAKHVRILEPGVRSRSHSLDKLIRTLVASATDSARLLQT
ncbi:MAG: DUF4276 family protein [Candidatus Thorarchaeota archaeon]